MKLPVVGKIQPQSKTFAMGVEKKARGYSKLDDSPDDKCLCMIEQPPFITNHLLTACKKMLSSNTVYSLKKLLYVPYGQKLRRHVS